MTYGAEYKTWAKIDEIITASLIRPSADLAYLLDACAEEGLPPIEVSHPHGQFLRLLIAISGAKRVLEIGTLGGYSAICMAEAVDADGHLITIEVDPKRAKLAEKNIHRAGFSDRVTVLCGKALDVLPSIKEAHKELFDLIFIDADKLNNLSYLKWAIRFARPGTLIVCDNIIRDMAAPESAGQLASAAEEFVTFMGEHPRLRSVALQTVGAKGYDGFSLSVVI